MIGIFKHYKTMDNLRVVLMRIEKNIFVSLNLNFKIEIRFKISLNNIQSVVELCLGNSSYFADERPGRGQLIIQLCLGWH